MSKNNNGNNEHYIEIVCESDVTNDEWSTMITYFNMKLKEHGFDNVKAILCDDSDE